MEHRIDYVVKILAVQTYNKLYQIYRDRDKDTSKLVHVILPGTYMRA